MLLRTYIESYQLYFENHHIFVKFRDSIVWHGSRTDSYKLGRVTLLNFYFKYSSLPYLLSYFTDYFHLSEKSIKFILLFEK